MEKVLIYALSEGYGGIEEFALNLLRFDPMGVHRFGFGILGHKTVYEQELKDLGAEYFFIPPKRKVLANIRCFWKLLGELRGTYDTVYFNTSGLYYPMPYLLAALRGYRIVLHSHLMPAEDWKAPLHKFNRLWIGRLCQGKLACSRDAARWMFGKKASQATFVPNGVELERFAYDPEKALQVRRQLKLEGKFVIGHVGRLAPVKNQKRLLEILAAVNEIQADGTLLLVGAGQDLENLKAQAEQMGLARQVIFYGATRQPQIPMLAMDCFVMPSLAEGFPVTLVEAQAAGLPCLVSTHVTEEVNLTGDVTFLPLEADNSLWAKTICSLPSGRQDHRERLISLGFDAGGLSARVWSLVRGGEDF